MFSYAQYDKICRSIAGTGCPSLTVDEARKDASYTGVLLKHDVEYRPETALALAKIEAKHGLKSTFYFHGFFLNNPEVAEMVREIESLGHEVGYHYDVLDATDGDFTRANEVFRNDLTRFAEEKAPVRTVCPHGNPLKKRVGWNSNKDFFKSDDIRAQYPDIFDIVNDGPEFFGSSFVYFSDAGFQLKQVGDIKHNDQSNESAMDDGKPASVADLVQLLERNEYAVVISLHPHRMSESALQVQMQKTRFFILRKGARLIMKIPFTKTLLSPLYAFTKRF